MAFATISNERLHELRSAIQVLKRDSRTGILYALDQTNVNPWKTDVIKEGAYGDLVNGLIQWRGVEINLYLPFSGAPSATIAEIFSELDRVLQTETNSHLILRYTAALELWMRQHPRPEQNRCEAWLILYRAAKSE